MAISRNGIIDYSISEVPFNTDSFCTFIESLRIKKGIHILLDNVRFHKTKKALATFERKGYIPCFIPPYSPDFNPIEISFSILKSKVRYLNVQQAFSQSVIIQTVKNVINDIKNSCFKSLYKFSVNECRKKLSS